MKAKSIIQAPEWMRKRMEAERSRPPVSLSEMLRQGNASAGHQKKLTGNASVIPAPDWLKKRMTDLRSESPAPLSEVIRQGVASEQHRKKFSGNQSGS
jgi:hypothetical protein